VRDSIERLDDMVKTVLQLLGKSPRGESLSADVWLVCRALQFGHCGVTEHGRLFFCGRPRRGSDYDVKGIHASRRRRIEGVEAEIGTRCSVTVRRKKCCAGAEAEGPGSSQPPGLALAEYYVLYRVLYVSNSNAAAATWQARSGLAMVQAFFF
jgi:hypothetical protein